MLISPSSILILHENPAVNDAQLTCSYPCSRATGGVVPARSWDKLESWYVSIFRAHLDPFLLFGCVFRKVLTSLLPFLKGLLFLSGTVFQESSELLHTTWLWRNAKAVHRGNANVMIISVGVTWQYLMTLITMAILISISCIRLSSASVFQFHHWRVIVISISVVPI